MNNISTGASSLPCPEPHGLRSPARGCLRRLQDGLECSMSRYVQSIFTANLLQRFRAVDDLSRHCIHSCEMLLNDQALLQNRGEKLRIGSEIECRVPSGHCEKSEAPGIESHIIGPRTNVEAKRCLNADRRNSSRIQVSLGFVVGPAPMMPLTAARNFARPDQPRSERPMSLNGLPLCN